MLPVTNESNHNAVVQASTKKDIKTSIITENMKGNDVIKSISEKPTVEMENIDVPTSSLHILNMISEENITDNRLRRQRVKTKDSVMPGSGLYNSIVEVTRLVERKSLCRSCKQC